MPLVIIPSVLVSIRSLLSLSRVTSTLNVPWSPPMLGAPPIAMVPPLGSTLSRRAVEGQTGMEAHRGVQPAMDPTQMAHSSRRKGLPPRSCSVEWLRE